MNLERVIAVRTNETVYRGGDQCVKVFGDGFTKADALGEALNQARVEEYGLHVPKVLEVSQVDGKWALVTEYVEGKTLERLIAEEPGRKEELLERMAELQVEMISKSCPLLSRLREELENRIARADLPATTRCDLFFRLHEIPGRRALSVRLEPCVSGKRGSGCRQRLAVVPAGRRRSGSRPVSGTVLPKDRHGAGNDTEVDPHRGRRPFSRGRRKGTHFPFETGQR